MTSDSLARQPLGVQIADRLRREILFGVLRPEHRVTQDSICERFGTSRIPVRDALRTLIHEGLVRTTRTGIEITPLTERDLEDIFRIEGTLHALATRLAVERATDEQLAALVDMGGKIKAAMVAGQHDVAASLNSAFHREINRLADSRRIISALRATSAKIDSEYLSRFPEDGDEALGHHDRILEAMLARNAETAAALMLDHVTANAKALHDNLVEIRAAAGDATLPEVIPASSGNTR